MATFRQWQEKRKASIPKPTPLEKAIKVPCGPSIKPNYTKDK